MEAGHEGMVMPRQSGLVGNEPLQGRWRTGLSPGGCSTATGEQMMHNTLRALMSATSCQMSHAALKGGDLFQAATIGLGWQRS